MSFRLRIAFAVLWLFSASATFAQVGFSLPFINAAAPGTYQNMTVKVTNFDSVVSMQYVIRWNPAVLKYTTINNFGHPSIDISKFNTTNAIDSGFVKFVWEGPNSFPGVSLADGTTIFRFRFLVVGSDTSSTPVKFTEATNTFPRLDFEIVQVINADSTLQAFDEQQCALTQGFVAVGYTVATSEIVKDALALTVSPNPFSEQTNVEFYLEHNTDVQMLIADATGRMVFQKELPNLPSGKNSINIEKAVFPAKGAYFLTIRTGLNTSVRSMILN